MASLLDSTMQQQTLPGFSPLLAEQLHELTGDSLAEATLDRQTRLVRNVALLGPESRNGYRYTQEAMQQAVALYEGRPVFIDHAGGDGRGWQAGAAPTRSVRDYAGKVVSPRFENQRVRGDLLLTPHADWLLSLIESAPTDLGMSHVVLARRNHAGDTVEEIERVISVDIVAFPATTQSFRESSPAPRRPCPTPCAACRSCPLSARQLVEQSHIPPPGRTATLYQLLQASAEPDRLLALLETYWRETLCDVPMSIEKPAPASSDAGPSPSVRRALVAAIRGR